MLKRIINDLLNRLAILYHVGTISLAGFAFMAPMLIPSQKPGLRKFQRFSTSERYRMLG